MNYTDPDGLFALGRVPPPAGETIYDIGAGTTISVMTTWNGTTTNPYTGLVGLQVLASARSFYDSLGVLDGLLAIYLELRHQEGIRTGQRLMSYRSLDECAEAGDCKIAMTPPSDSWWEGVLQGN